MSVVAMRSRVLLQDASSLITIMLSRPRPKDPPRIVGDRRQCCTHLLPFDASIALPDSE